MKMVYDIVHLKYVVYEQVHLKYVVYEFWFSSEVHGL